jgi:RluA family pseudouridine synthase
MGLIFNIQVLFCDDALLVVDKPAGLSTLPDGYNPNLPHIKSELEPQFGHLWIVHRLDKETSGVLLLARSREAHRSLNTQFEQHLVSKVYHALVHGNPGWKEKTVDLSLRSNGDHRHRTVIDPQGGKPAITHFRIIERFPGYCLVKAQPETGRTHQIRAHLLSLGFPIIGDKLYRKWEGREPAGNILSPQPENVLVAWPALCIGLHARTLEINHPETGASMKFSAPYSRYFIDALSQLRSNPDTGG